MSKKVVDLTLFYGRSRGKSEKKIPCPKNKGSDTSKISVKRGKIDHFFRHKSILKFERLMYRKIKGMRVQIKIGTTCCKTYFSGFATYSTHFFLRKWVVDLIPGWAKMDLHLFQQYIMLISPLWGKIDHLTCI